MVHCCVLMLVTDYDDSLFFYMFLLSVYRDAKVLEGLSFCIEVRCCDQFVPVPQGHSTSDEQMKVCSFIAILVLINFSNCL